MLHASKRKGRESGHLHLIIVCEMDDKKDFLFQKEKKANIVSFHHLIIMYASFIFKVYE